MDSIFSAKVNIDKYEPCPDDIPRILIRGWHPGTAAAALGLNTARGMYPFAWQYLLPASNTRVSREPPSLPSRLTELSRVAVTALASAHIGGEVGVATPFTSWTADLPTAVFFALGSYSEIQNWEMNEPGYIAVLDLPQPRPIIHVPSLGWSSLPMEYLIYGPVTQGLRVISITAIRTTLQCDSWPFCHGVKREPHRVTEEEIRDSLRVGLLFQSTEDKFVDVAVVMAASLLSWAQVPVGSPRPLGEADLLRAERQQTRPWPQEDLENIMSSRLLVHNGGGPPLSGSILGNPQTSTVGAPQLELTMNLLTKMQTAWGPASDTAGTSRPHLTREQWEAAFRAAADQYSPIPHNCGPFSCKFCGKSRAGATATDWLRPESIYFCTKRCLNSQARKARAEKGAETPEIGDRI